MRNVLKKGEISEQIGRLNEASQYLMLLSAEQKQDGKFALSIALESIVKTITTVNDFLGE